MTRAELVALIEAKIQDQGSEVSIYQDTRGLSSQNLVLQTITDNTDELSDYAPQKKIEDFTGTGSLYYALDALTDWPDPDGNTEINRVWLELPVDDSVDRDAYELSTDFWTVDYWLIAGVQKKSLVFRGIGSPSLVRVEYFINQEFPDAGAISLEPQHIGAFTDLVAGKYLMALAANMIQTVSDSPVSDALNPLNPVRTVQSAAQILIDKFYMHFGDDPRAPGSARLRQWTKASDKTRRDWIFGRG